MWFFLAHAPGAPHLNTIKIPNRLMDARDLNKSNFLEKLLCGHMCDFENLGNQIGQQILYMCCAVSLAYWSPVLYQRGFAEGEDDAENIQKLNEPLIKIIFFKHSHGYNFVTCVRCNATICYIEYQHPMYNICIYNEEKIERVSENDTILLMGKASDHLAIFDASSSRICINKSI